MQAEDEQRENLIKKSRDVLKLSKGSIYSLHRGDVAKAKEQVTQAKEIAKRELLPIIAAAPHLRFGALSGALEEFAEACVFSEFLASGRIPTLAELEIVNKEEYLGGVMDFTGELNRYAVLVATKRDIAAVTQCREAVDQLFSQLQLFDFRNGNLRRKFDTVRCRFETSHSLQVAEETSWIAAGRGIVDTRSLTAAAWRIVAHSPCHAVHCR